MVHHALQHVTKQYPGLQYEYTDIINHGGTVVAFAQTSGNESRLVYTVLDVQVDDVERGNLDKDFWSQDVRNVPFPREITEVGFSIAGATRIPLVHVKTKEEIASGGVKEKDIGAYYSSTARLARNDCAFRVISNGSHLYIFRQAVADTDVKNLFLLKNGGSSADTSRDINDFVLSGSNKVSLVHKTLLCDVYVLVGTSLKLTREVRYRRSRHRTQPASKTDALGSTDMEGNPFYLPTHNLSFVRGTNGDSFDVLQIPTEVSGLMRWQIFVTNELQRVDAYNCEVGSNGLFNLSGTQLYTSPDDRFTSSVLERSPGKCPFTNRPLTPKKNTSGHAESCLYVSNGGDGCQANIAEWRPQNFTVEMWVKSNVDVQEDNVSLFLFHSANARKGFISINEHGNYHFVFSGYLPSPYIIEVAPHSREWGHLAMTYDGNTIRTFWNGVEQQTLAASGMSVEFEQMRIASGIAYRYASGAVGTGDFTSFNGWVDEVRVWNRPLSSEEIQGRMNSMLLGNEPGLRHCWSFDEGGGNIAFDKGPGGADLSVVGTFVYSDCPIGSGNGLRRSSFSISGSSTSVTHGNGVSACLYYQQEKVATGYDNALKPMKKQARVMVLIHLEQSGYSTPYPHAAVDIGVSKEGRIAQLPDVLSLPSITKPAHLDTSTWGSDPLKIPDVNLHLSYIHTDPSGLSACGAILDFAQALKCGSVLPTANGHLAFYYKDETDGKFSVCYYDTNVERARFEVSPALTLHSRVGGNYAADVVQISAGSSSTNCTLVIRETSRNISETWTNLPRDPRQAAKLLNGEILRPSDLSVANTLATADTSGRSYLVAASFSATEAQVQISDGQINATPGIDAAWISPEPSYARSFNQQYAAYLRNGNENNTIVESDISMEVWFKRTNLQTISSFEEPHNLVYHCSPNSAYRLVIKQRTGSGQKHYVVFQRSNGSASNHDGEICVRTSQFRANQWVHIGVTYKQSYSLALTTSQYADCGTNSLLNLTKDFTIEVFFQVSDVSRSHGILGKGTIGTGGVPFQLKITDQGHLQLVVESESGVKTFTSSLTLNANQFYRVAVTKAIGNRNITETSPYSIDVEEGDQRTSLTFDAVTSVEVEHFYEVKFFIDGTEAGTSRSLDTDTPPLPSPEPFEIGRRRTGINATESMDGIISQVRLWDQALSAKEVCRDASLDDARLVAWWNFEEREGNIAHDLKETSHGKLQGSAWVRNPDWRESTLKMYFQGRETPIYREHVYDNHEGCYEPFTDVGFYLGCGEAQNYLKGELDEVRVWNTVRTHEQVVDNMFSRLKGEKKDLVCYYTFDGDSGEKNKPHIYDQSFHGNHISMPAPYPHSVRSTAPPADEAPILRNSLTPQASFLQASLGTSDAPPCVTEYSDMQRDANGNLFGVYKRCYSYTQDDIWTLVTGFKVGDLETEWIGQAQFDPQVIGYVEGAPPVPSENLTAGLVAAADGAGVIEVLESDSVSLSVGVSKEGSWNAAYEASAHASAGSDDLMILAPLGVGTAKKITDVSVNVGVKGNFQVETGWSQSETVSGGIVRNRNLTVSTGGGFEDADTNNQLNAEVGRRAVPGNAGLALVQSSTADVFALRLAHNQALVSLRMLPNPDIPPDWNLLPFPINPRYTKQGTLDGRVGHVLDPEYSTASAYGEYSYYKPTEAYKIEERIRRDEQRVMSYYEDIEVGASDAVNNLVGSAASAAASLMVPGKGSGIAQGALDRGQRVVQNSSSSGGVSTQFAKRDIVNTYVWSAEGGFFEESTETTFSRTEVVAGNFGFSGAFGLSLNANVDIFSIGVDFEMEAALGGGMSMTKTKSKDTEKAFSMQVAVDVPGILQKYELHAGTKKYLGVYDDSGNPVTAAGKVDAYRFKTFYLDASSQNFEDLFEKVIDPIWLASNNPNASSLRQANQSTKKPPCWRVFHRVTFVSRILPTKDADATPMEQAMKQEHLDSNWQLIQTLSPFVMRKRNNMAEFSVAVTDAVEDYLPQLVPYTTEIVQFLALYHGVPGAL